MLVRHANEATPQLLVLGGVLCVFGSDGEGRSNRGGHRGGAGSRIRGVGLVAKQRGTKLFVDGNLNPFLHSRRVAPHFRRPGGGGGGGTCWERQQRAVVVHYAHTLKCEIWRDRPARGQPHVRGVDCQEGRLACVYPPAEGMLAHRRTHIYD